MNIRKTLQNPTLWGVVTIVSIGTFWIPFFLVGYRNMYALNNKTPVPTFVSVNNKLVECMSADLEQNPAIYLFQAERLANVWRNDTQALIFDKNTEKPFFVSWTLEETIHVCSQEWFSSGNTFYFTKRDFPRMRLDTLMILVFGSLFLFAFIAPFMLIITTFDLMTQKKTVLPIVDLEKTRMVNVNGNLIK